SGGRQSAGHRAVALPGRGRREHCVTRRGTPGDPAVRPPASDDLGTDRRARRRPNSDHQGSAGSRTRALRPGAAGRTRGAGARIRRRQPGHRRGRPTRSRRDRARPRRREGPDPGRVPHLLDAPKASARAALERLAALGIAVKVITGDNPVVAAKVCRDLGLPNGGTLTGTDLDAMNDAQLAAAVPGTMAFARVSPEHKARIVRAQRTSGVGVAFLGDGVNDALALHAADVGISVDSGSDVAKDAADVILLEKDLGVLADGVVEGRRIFANTIKYVLMGTSSNFGNMFS